MGFCVLSVIIYVHVGDHMHEHVLIIYVGSWSCFAALHTVVALHCSFLQCESVCLLAGAVSLPDSSGPCCHYSNGKENMQLGVSSPFRKVPP